MTVYGGRSKPKGDDVIEALAKLLEDPKKTAERVQKAAEAEKAAAAKVSEAESRISSALAAERKANDALAKVLTERAAVDKDKSDLASKIEKHKADVAAFTAEKRDANLALKNREAAVVAAEAKLAKREEAVQAREDTITARERAADEAKAFAEDRVRRIQEAVV